MKRRPVLLTAAGERRGHPAQASARDWRLDVPTCPGAGAAGPLSSGSPPDLASLSKTCPPPRAVQPLTTVPAQDGPTWAEPGLGPSSCQRPRRPQRGASSASWCGSSLTQCPPTGRAHPSWAAPGPEGPARGSVTVAGLHPEKMHPTFMRVGLCRCRVRADSQRVLGPPPHSSSTQVHKGKGVSTGCRRASAGFPQSWTVLPPGQPGSALGPLLPLSQRAPRGLGDAGQDGSCKALLSTPPGPWPQALPRTLQLVDKGQSQGRARGDLTRGPAPTHSTFRISPGQT
ncbi:hypothetical protein GHT09_010111 [Marmota monax]|uniref:Uncharacterized protein n=1 Tax=Marmota monax TaxID=9995 RepID=A0A834UL68_MARMO|nr:hypothetical protein GHT09_010111 [Marmota monax]